jgi:DHA2 family multidrug resistance protein-like MFS transporter
MNEQLEAIESGSQARSDTLAITAVLAAMVLVVLDAAIVNVALPSIASALHVQPAQAIWVITAYQAALVMALLPCAALGESYGYRKVFTLGVTLFIGASALCALSPSLVWLVAARFFQGLGGAAVMAFGVALLRSVLCDRRLGVAIGWNALTVALSSAAGPALGAAILSTASWQWLFAINLPLGFFVLIASRALPDTSGTGRRLDAQSVALNVVAGAAFVVGTEMLPAEPVVAVAFMAAALGAFIALIRRERPKDAPLIPLDLLRAPSFRVSVMASILCFTAVGASVIALPFYLQHELGQSIWMTGLYMTPWPLSVAVAAPLVTRVATRVSPVWLCTAGGVCLALGLTGAALWPLEENLLPLALLTGLCGLGFGLFQVSNNQSMFLSAPPQRSGAAGGMQGAARLTGQTAGAILMTLLFTLASIQAAPRLGLAIAAVFALAAGVTSARRAHP